MKIKFDVTSQELTIIQKMLQSALPAQCKAWVFGSRAKHQAKYNSDFDLAIECSQALDKRTLMKLEEGFEESRLPYRVDVVDMCKVNADFKKIIDGQKVVFPVKANVPELRFSEFSGDWDFCTIQSLIDSGTIIGHLDGNHGELYPKSDEFSDEGIPYVSANDLVGQRVNLSNSKRLPLKRASLFKKGIAHSGDVIFAHNATVGPTGILDTKLDFVILSTTVTYYRCNLAKLDNRFLLNSLNAVYFVKQYSRVMSQSTRNQVPITMQRKFYLQLPEIKEQQKNATFLSAVDDKLNTLRRKRELLETYKRGLMQKIFLQEIRFKQDDGSEFSDWNRESLGKYLSLHVERVDASTDLLVYSSTREGLKPQKDYYDNREVINEGEYGVVPVGFFVYRHMSDDLTFKFNINNTGNAIAVSKEYPVFTTANLDKAFLLYKLNHSSGFKRFAIAQKKGGTRTRLYFKVLCSWLTMIPDDIEEQPKNRQLPNCLRSKN